MQLTSKENKDKPVHTESEQQKPTSYSMINPRMKRVYFNFYREAYTNRGAALDHKTKELISIAASVVARCDGCLKGHIRKAIKDGATQEEMLAAIYVAVRVNKAAIIDAVKFFAPHLLDNTSESGETMNIETNENLLELSESETSEQPETDLESSSYSLLDPKMRRIYGDFRSEVYNSEHKYLDHKTQQLISIAAALIAKCQSCIEEHIETALKEGATKEEISETIAIALAINAAAVVDLTDIAATNLNLNFFPSEGSKVRE
jgi:AhpD family alkylhydroperoxidase